MKVSVLVPVFNGVQFVRESINSVLKQTVSDVEVIVIDDGSTEPVWEELEKIKDFRVRKFRNETNLGHVKTLNKCLHLAVGDFIVRQDADDISLPNRFAEQLKLFTEEVGFVGCWARSIDKRGMLDVGHFVDIHCRITNNEIRTLYPLKLCIAEPTIMYSRAAVEKVGFYDEFLLFGETYNHSRRVQKYFRGCIVPKILYCRRRRMNSLTKTMPMAWKKMDVVKLCNERATMFPVIKMPEWLNECGGSSIQ